MKNILIKIIMLVVILTTTSCGYHLRSNNLLAESYPQVKLSLLPQSLLKRPLANALISSGVQLVDKSTTEIIELKIHKDSLRKVVQSIGANNQIQEYRLEYDVEYSIAGGQKNRIHLEKDYSFDIQQIGGGQQEEITLRKQLADDMAWAIIRQINVAVANSK